MSENMHVWNNIYLMTLFQYQQLNRKIKTLSITYMLVYVHTYLYTSANKEGCVKVTAANCYGLSLFMIKRHKELSRGHGHCWKGMMFSFALK